MGLRTGDHHAVLAVLGQHAVGEDDDAVVAGVHHAYRLDVAELLVLRRLLAAHLVTDVLRRHVGLLLGGETGLGDGDGVGRSPRYVDSGGDADGVDVVVGLGLVRVVHPHVALFVVDLDRLGDHVLPDERWDQHGVGEVHAGAVLEHDAALVDVVDGNVHVGGDLL